MTDTAETGETDQLYALPARWRVHASASPVPGRARGLDLPDDRPLRHDPLVCTDADLINCEKVTTSAQSYFLGIPVAVLGLVFSSR